jgi:hypothetical protein
MTELVGALPWPFYELDRWAVKWDQVTLHNPAWADSIGHSAVTANYPVVSVS